MIKKLSAILFIFIVFFSGCSKNDENKSNNVILSETSVPFVLQTTTNVNEYTLEERFEIEPTIQTTEETTIQTDEITATELETTIEENFSELETRESFSEISLQDKIDEICMQETMEQTMITNKSDSEVITEDNSWLDTNTDFSWYDNMMFLGDSVCSGLKLYNGLLNVNQVIAKGNVGSWSINDYTFQYENSTNELDYLSIVKMYQPEKLFIFIGMNDLYILSPEERNQNIETIKNNILSVSENTEVYVLSLTPISDSHKWAANDGKSRINKYNESLREYCDSSDSIQYIDIYNILSNNDNLIDKFDGGDGLHLSAAAYIRILNKIQDDFS